MATRTEITEPLRGILVESFERTLPRRIQYKRTREEGGEVP